MSNTDPVNYSFIDPQTSGIKYKYFIGSEQPVDYATFKANHSTIFDSSNGAYFEVKYKVLAKRGYKLNSAITTVGHIDFSNANTVIKNVDLPKLSSTTVDSHNFDIDIHKIQEVKTEFSLDGGVN